jgi:hypothetical protein
MAWRVQTHFQLQKGDRVNRVGRDLLGVTQDEPPWGMTVPAKSSFFTGAEGAVLSEATVLVSLAYSVASGTTWLPRGSSALTRGSPRLLYITSGMNTRSTLLHHYCELMC